MSEKYITAIHLWWYKCPTRKGWVWHHPQDNTDPTDRLSRRSQVWGFLFTTDSPCNSQVSHNYRCLAGNRQPNNSAINLDSHITHGKPFPDTCVYPASVSDEIQHNSLWGSNSSMGLDLLTIITMHLLRQQLPIFMQKLQNHRECKSLMQKYALHTGTVSEMGELCLVRSGTSAQHSPKDTVI